ncbi:Protein of unknown function [Gryllus bimaculatus]|nr:Protein of unknown function [Gryllus bimaculatus]
MTSPLACVLLCLACALRGACAAAMGGAEPPAEPEEPKDPRCCAVNNEADERDFILKGKALYASGCYESDVLVDDEGNFEGEFSPLIDLDVDLPVYYSLEMSKDNDFTPIAGGTDTMQGMLDKYASVVANINCYLNKPFELPMPKPSEAIKVNKCSVFARQFPKGFEEGEYKVVVNQTSPKGEEYCGLIEIFFELENK